MGFTEIAKMFNSPNGLMIWNDSLKKKKIGVKVTGAQKVSAVIRAVHPFWVVTC